MHPECLERFLQIASFERTGDPYKFHQWIWLEAIERWQKEGLPREAHPMQVVSFGQNLTEFLPVYNTSRCGRPYFTPPYYVAIVPWFKLNMIRNDKETQIFRDEDGITYRISTTTPGVLSQFLEFPVKDRATWNEYKRLLDLTTPERWRAGWDRINLAEKEHTRFAIPDGESRHK